MSLIVEYELRTPILRHAADAIGELRLEELYGIESGTAKLLFWAIGDEIESFESALAADPSVAEYTALDDAPDRTLYSVVLTDAAADKLTYPIAAELDIAILEIELVDEAVVRARVPSRDALFAYRQRCLEKGVGVRLRRIYREQEPDVDPYGVTDSQREALLAALEDGYFEVPRDATLSAVAAELDISDQALSARLRRGQATLLRHTLADDPT